MFVLLSLTKKAITMHKRPILQMRHMRCPFYRNRKPFLQGLLAVRRSRRLAEILWVQEMLTPFWARLRLWCGQRHRGPSIWFTFASPMIVMWCMRLMFLMFLISHMILLFLTQLKFLRFSIFLTFLMSLIKSFLMIIMLLVNTETTKRLSRNMTSGWQEGWPAGW